MSFSQLDLLQHVRDELIHGYFGVDYSIVWDVAKNKFPVLGAQIDQIITGGK